MYFTKDVLFYRPFFVEILTGLVFGALNIAPLQAQIISKGGFTGFDRPSSKKEQLDFRVRTYTSATEDLSQSRIIVQIGFSNAELQFIKANKKVYQADFKVEIVINDTNGVEVQRDDWSETVFADNFDDTVSPDLFNTTQETFILAPGWYDLNVKLTDVETKRQGVHTQRQHVRDFNDIAALSDIMFVNSLSFLDQELPETEETDEEERLYAYFEIYNVPQGDSIALDLFLRDSKKEIRGSKLIVSTGPLTSEYIDIGKHAFSKRELHIQLTVSHGNRRVHAEQYLSPPEKESNTLLGNLDSAIEVLKYIADKKEIDRMRSLTGDEQVTAFKDFWKSKDPTPETHDNEYMIAYYSRVKTANSEFTSITPGWKTQMGMVLIKLGPPHRMDSSWLEGRSANFGNRAIIVWYYPEYNRSVAFRYVGGEYRIANYGAIFDLIDGKDIRLGQ